MPGTSDLIQLMIDNPVTGTLIAAGTGTITLGAYWLYRNDDQKHVSRATKVVFFLLASVMAAAALTLGGMRLSSRRAVAASPTQPLPPANFATTETPVSNSTVEALDNTSDSAQRADARSRGTTQDRADKSAPSKAALPEWQIDPDEEVYGSPIFNDPVEAAQEAPKAPPQAVSKPAYYESPTVRFNANESTPVSECLYMDGRTGSVSGCGRSPADKFCQAAGKTRAASYSTRMAGSNETVYFYGTNVWDTPASFLPNRIYFKVLAGLTCE